MQRYKTMNLIGSGGHGSVYHARDQLTGQVVALKLIERLSGVTFSRKTQTTTLRNLAHEFSILATLRHPHIVTVYDYGFDAHNRPFFTMELLHNAQTITEATQTADFATRLELVIQLLQALSYLHRHGILHRDLKPENVLVVEGTVRLLDFGLAIPVETTPVPAGTPAYMPPETFTARPYVPASDLYAVGVILVEIFTGALPFQPGDILSVMEKPPNLDGIAVPQLRTITERLLAKDPADRYQRADMVIAALASVGNLTITEQPHIRESYLQAAPFMGRQPELEQLIAAFNDTSKRRGHAILVSGESGIGKSRLLYEFRIRALTMNALVLQGQATAESGMPYALMRQPLAHLAAMVDLTEQEAAIIRQFSAPSGESAAQQPLGAEAETRLVYALVNVLKRCPYPVVLILEDLHWAHESLSIIAHLSKRAAELPLLLIGSFRSDEAHVLPQQLEAMSLVRLNRLPTEHLAQLCRAIVGQAADNPRLVQRLQRESDGNVFFLIEILRALAEDVGQLSAIGDAPLPELILPEGIREILQRRLRYVPDWAQHGLKLAALTGRQIDPDLMRAMLEEAFMLDNWLYTCAEAALLEVYDNQWRFSHDKLREAMIVLLSAAEKPQLHKQVADGLEALHADEPAYARQLAEHWHLAGNDKKALHYTLIAGKYFQRIGAFKELEPLAEQAFAFEQTILTDYARLQLWQFLGDAYRYRDSEKALHAYEQARTLAVQHGWRDAEMSLLKGIAVIFRNQGHIARSEELIDDLMLYGRETHNVDLLLPALSMKAVAYLRRGDYQQAETHYNEIITLAARVNNPTQVATAWMNLGAVACMQGDLERGEAHFKHAEEAARAAGAIDIEVYCTLNLANIAMDQGQLGTAEVHFEQCTPMIETLGDFTLLAGAYYDRGDLAWLQRDHEKARHWFTKSLELAEQLQNMRWQSAAHFGLGKVAYLRQDYDQAEQLLHKSHEQAVAAELLTEQVSCLNYLARVYVRDGQTDRANHMILTALTQGLELGDTLLLIESAVSLVDLFIHYARFSQAATLYGVTAKHEDTQYRHRLELKEKYQQLLRSLGDAALRSHFSTAQTLTLVDLLQRLAGEIRGAQGTASAPEG
jgi:tetratricopeptide (TPR) repeat protein